MTERTNNKSVKFKKGEKIFSEGDMASCAYLILSGTVELSKVKEGTAEIAEYIKENSVFGEMALFDVKRRILNAKAFTDVECFEITDFFLQQELYKTSPIIKALLRVLSKSLKKKLENN